MSTQILTGSRAQTRGRTSTPATGSRSVESILAPLDALASRSNHLLRQPAQLEGTGRIFPRYLYLGERGGGDVIRLGIFAAIHGDEPEGARALVQFLHQLEETPDLGRGYAIFIYPICNPGGFAAGTRHAPSGLDLNRQFWQDSAEPEVRLLESEICLHAFHGIVTLHSDDTSDGLYGYVNGAVLSENLLSPALRAAERVLPRNRGGVIDGFPARDGIIHASYDGVLRSIPGLERPPFELTLETPQLAPTRLQEKAFVEALNSILAEYRPMLAIAQNI